MPLQTVLIIITRKKGLNKSCFFLPASVALLIGREGLLKKVWLNMTTKILLRRSWSPSLPTSAFCELKHSRINNSFTDSRKQFDEHFALFTFTFLRLCLPILPTENSSVPRQPGQDGSKLFPQGATSHLDEQNETKLNVWIRLFYFSNGNHYVHSV